MVNDIDCVPTDVTKVFQFHSTHKYLHELYWYLYSIASMLENAFGFHVCIDLGSPKYFYETGEPV